jgi:lipopolysaccharide export system protein LptA
MLPWQRRLRLVLAIILVGFGATVYFALRDRKVPVVKPVETATDAKVISESRDAALVQLKGSRQDIKIEFRRHLSFSDGTTRLEGVTVTADERAGRNFVITSRQAEVGMDQQEFRLSGAVKLVANDGLTINTDRATFRESDGALRAPERITFSKGAMTGSSIGGNYDRDTDVLTLRERAVVRIEAETPDDEALEIKAGHAVIARRDRYMQFEGGTQMERVGRKMESKTAMAHLAADQDRIQLMEMRGDARITGEEATPGALRVMRGEEVNLTYADDGRTIVRALLHNGARIRVAGAQENAERVLEATWIDIGFAPDGTTVTSLTGREQVQLTLPAEADAPARRIRSIELAASGSPDRGLTSADFTGGVEFREGRQNTPGAHERLAKSKTLTLALVSGFSTIDEALFKGDARMSEDRLNAEADQARYLVKRGVLELAPGAAAKARPRVTDGDATIEANAIVITFEGRQIDARGDVRSELKTRQQDEKKGEKNTGAAATKVPALLDEGQPVFVTGKTLAYGGADSNATYTGDVRLWQGETAIQSDQLVLDNKTGNLTATGNVRSSLVTTQAKAEGRPADAKPLATDPADTGQGDAGAKKPGDKSDRVILIGSGAELYYDDAARRATYVKRAHVQGPQGDLTAQKIELYLDRAGDALERAEAYEAVRLHLDTRDATGDRLTYTAADEKYLMHGNPVKIVEECQETTGRTLTFFKSIDTITIDGNEANRTQTRNGANCSEQRAR